MDIRNYIRIEALVDLSQMDAGAKHLDRYTAAIDRHNLALRRLQAAPAERALMQVAKAAQSVSSMTGAALTRMQSALRNAIGSLASLGGPAKAGFSAVVAAAESAARRTVAAFQQLRLALPRLGIEGLTRPLQAAIPVVQRGFATIATAARSAFTSASATVVRFAGTVQGAMARVAASLGVSGSFTGGLDRLRRNIIAADSDLKRMAAGGTGATKAFTSLFERVNQASTGFVNAARTLRALGAAEYSAVASTAALELGLRGLRGTIGTIGAGATSIFSGLKAGLSGASSGGPAIGNAVAAAGGWNLVARASAAAGATMRAAGLVGVAALRGIAATAAATGAAIHTAFLGASVALGAVGAVSTIMGARFEQAMNKVFALTSVTPDQFKALSAQVVELSRTVPRSATELANGLYYVVSAGIAVKDAFDVLAISAKAAVAGQTSVEVVANAVTSAMLAYSSAANKAAGITLTAAEAANIITRAVVEGKTEFDTFANSIGRVLPLASQLGISFEEVAAALATVTRIGLSSDEAATALRGLFSEIVQSSKPGGAKDALASVGLSSASLQNSLSEQGLLGTLKLVYDAFGGNIEQIELFIPNIRALTGFLALANSQADAYAQVLYSVQQANEGAGAAQEAFEKAMETLVNQLTLVRNQVGAIGIAIFNVLQPALVAITQSIGGFLNRIIDWINLNPDLFKSIVQVSGALTALTLISIGLPKLLQTLSVFFVLFGGATVRSRGALAGLGVVLAKLLPVFVLASVAAIGLGRAFNVDLGEPLGRVREAILLLGTDTGRVLGQVGTLVGGIFKILGSKPPEIDPRYGTERFVTPLMRVQAFVEQWQTDSADSWLLFRGSLQRIVVSIGNIFSGIGDQIRVPLANLTSIFNALAPMVLPAIGRFVETAVDAGGQFVVKLVNGFIKAAPKIAEGMNVVKTAVVDWVLATVPVLADRLGRWAVEVGPLLLDAFGKIVAGLASWLIEQGPRIAGALASWAVTAVFAIAAAAGAALDELLKVLQDTNLVEAVASWIPQVIAWILTQFIPAVLLAMAYLIPKLAAVMFEAGVQAVDGLVRGIGRLEGPLQVVVSLITALLVPALLAWIATMARAAIVTGINLVGSLTQLVVQILATSAALTVNLLVSLAGVVGMAARLAFALGAEGIGGLLVGLVGKMAGLAATLGGIGAAGDVAAVGLGGAGIAAGGLLAILSGVGIAVAIFAAAYATNFLGIRDITNDVVEQIGDGLSDLGDSIVDVLRNLHLLDGWASSQGGSRDEIDKLGQSYRDLQEALQDIKGPEHALATAGSRNVDALATKITDLGDRYGKTAEDAIAAFIKIARASPRAGENQWIADTILDLQGLPTSIDIAATHLHDFFLNGKAALPGFLEATLGVGTAVADLTEEERRLLQKNAEDWEAWQQRQDAAIQKARDSIINASDPVRQALSSIQSLFGEGIVLPEFDPGATRSQQITVISDALAVLRTKLAGLTDPTAEQIAIAKDAITALSDQLLILTNGLDTFAASLGVDLPQVLARFRELQELHVANPLDEIRKEIAAHPETWSLPSPTVDPPKPETITQWVGQLTKLWAGKVNNPDFLEATLGGGLSVPVTLDIPETLFDPGRIVGDSGTKIVSTIQAQMNTAAAANMIGSMAVANSIRGIIGINSEPTDSRSPLAGITRWGLNMALTVALGLMRGRLALTTAALVALGGVTAPFVKLIRDVYFYGLATGGSYAAGLRAAAPIVTLSAYQLANAARLPLFASSPPGPESPLHHVMDWGFATMEAFAEGMESAQGRIKQAAINAVGAAGPILQQQMAFGGIGTGGPQQATMWATPDSTSGLAFAASGNGTLVPGLLADLVHEQRLHSQLLARMAAKDPDAAGPPAARGELDKLRWLRGQNRS